MTKQRDGLNANADDMADPCDGHQSTSPPRFRRRDAKICLMSGIQLRLAFGRSHSTPSARCLSCSQAAINPSSSKAIGRIVCALWHWQLWIVQEEQQRCWRRSSRTAREAVFTTRPSRGRGDSDLDDGYTASPSSTTYISWHFCKFGAFRANTNSIRSAVHVSCTCELYACVLYALAGALLGNDPCSRLRVTLVMTSFQGHSPFEVCAGSAPSSTKRVRASKLMPGTMSLRSVPKAKYGANAMRRRYDSFSASRVSPLLIASAR